MMTENWSSSAHRATAQFEAWRHALNNSHLEWRLEAPTDPAFGARIRQRTLDGVRIIECRCDPCTGWRRRPELRRTEGAWFGILFELSGREVIRQGDREAVLKAGDFVLWDSEREMEFRVLKPLHKLSLLIPKARMNLLLGDAERHAGTVVPSSGRTEGISAEALRRLARDFTEIDADGAHAVIEPLLSLLSATIMTRYPPSRGSASHLDSFRSICRHIECNLGDGGLTPASVAAAHGVSLRYLHLVFAEQGTTFGRFLRQRRLACCYREIADAGQGRTITEIAFRWGFNDMAHFSRVFRAEFRMSPRELAQGAK